MKIEKDVVVTLTYTLRNTSAEGEIIEVCDILRPLEFVCESGSMLPHFEKNIKGLEVASTFEFTIEANNAYGVVNESAIVEVNKDIFIVDGVVREDLLEIGKIIPMRDNSGHPLNGKIVAVKDAENVVVIDFNHPLAGTDLHFKGKIEAIRAATEEELAYGLGGSGGCGCGSGGGCGDGGCGSGGCGSDDCGPKEEGGGCGSGSCGCGH